jgi:hypothetical protein
MQSVSWLTTGNTSFGRPTRSLNIRIILNWALDKRDTIVQARLIGLRIERQWIKKAENLLSS